MAAISGNRRRSFEHAAHSHGDHRPVIALVDGQASPLAPPRPRGARVRLERRHAERGRSILERRRGRLLVVHDELVLRAELLVQHEQRAGRLRLELQLQHQHELKRWRAVSGRVPRRRRRWSHAALRGLVPEYVGRERHDQAARLLPTGRGVRRAAPHRRLPTERCRDAFTRSRRHRRRLAEPRACPPGWPSTSTPATRRGWRRRAPAASRSPRSPR